MPTRAPVALPAPLPHPWQSSLLPCLNPTQNFKKKLLSQVCTCVFLRKTNAFFYFPSLSLSLKSKLGIALPSIQAGGALPRCTHQSQRQCPASQMLSMEDEWNFRKGTGEASAVTETSQHSG